MGLTLEQMVRMSALLDEAMDLDAQGWQRWLDDLSPENQDLAEALREALFLRVLLDAPARLSRDEGEAKPESSSSDLAPGQRVGPYELVRLLGRGGMAEVWLAKRADGVFKREVALKLPMVSRLRKDLQERFVRERDILASLEHPNIARLYDGGVDAQGLPYLAMEYVPGTALSVWCDACKLGIRERLALFLQILDAVQYAHEKQVIHRDLKPSNILVSESGQVRLLDFGVAKLLAEDAEQIQLTSVYGRALTPDYASPELLTGGDPIDARSDVYSLGIVLYELLSGARPYRLQGASLGMLGQAISTVDVKEPSTQVELQAAVARSSTREGLARQLRGDLDAIVLKALARDPADRYESAKAVHEDLGRYLQNHPIKAYRAPFAYRVKKFVSRHRPVIGVSALASALLLVISGYQFAKRETTSTASPPFSPPPHSIGVLPFSNLSGDPTQEYFSDGMSEELIDVLSHFDGLQVAARTSSFSLKGKNADIRSVARELGVGAILEGSIRRSGNKVRITAQLVDAVSGFRLWSETYDRDAGDVLRLQSEIARAVASALRVTLLGDGAANAEVGATRDPAAFDAYLRAATANATAEDAKGFQDAIAAYTEAIKLDANYALAFAGRSRALSEYAEEAGAPTGDSLERAQADARQAITLAPGLAEGHLALARIHISSLDVAHANEELERARALAPGNVEVLGFYGDFAVGLGHAATGIAALRRAAALDPLNANSYVALGFGLFLAHQYDEAVTAFRQAMALNPQLPLAQTEAGLAYYALGEFERARSSCEPARAHWRGQSCLALVYEKLGRHTDAQAMLAEVRSRFGDTGAYGYTYIYAQWGQINESLRWLDTALRRRDTDLLSLPADPLMDPLRNEPRFRAIESALKLPED